MRILWRYLVRPPVMGLLLAGGLLAFLGWPWLGEMAPGSDLQQTARISRRPPPQAHPVHRLDTLAVPARAYDVRTVSLSHADLSQLDLTGSGDLLDRYASFDTATRWPRRLPAGFDPGRRLELGKDPGLGVRALHRKGITGKGVHVAYVHQTLLVEHREYAQRLVRYEEIGLISGDAEEHGAAVASLLAGRTVGVAPEVRLTYFAAQLAENGGRTLRYAAQAIERILDQNRNLPPADRVRVIGLSLGPNPGEPGYAEFLRALERARAEGVYVATTVATPVFPFGIQGLDRLPEGDPNDLRSYLPGVWWREEFYREPGAFEGLFLLPMDSRTMAAETGPAEYRYDRQAGLSWSVPYLVGVYALALQVEPELTPDLFFRLAAATGQTISLAHDGREYRLGPIVYPAGIVRALTGAS